MSLYTTYKERLDGRRTHASYRWFDKARGYLKYLDGVYADDIAVYLDRPGHPRADPRPTLILYADGRIWFHAFRAIEGGMPNTEALILREATREVMPEMGPVYLTRSPTLKLLGWMHWASPRYVGRRGNWRDPAACEGTCAITTGPIWITKDGYQAIDEAQVRVWDKEKRALLIRRLKFLNEQLIVRSELRVFGDEAIPGLNSEAVRRWSDPAARQLLELDFEDQDFEIKFRSIVRKLHHLGEDKQWSTVRRKQIRLTIDRLKERLRRLTGAVSYLSETELREAEDVESLVVLPIDDIRAVPPPGQTAVRGQDSGAGQAA